MTPDAGEKTKDHDPFVLRVAPYLQTNDLERFFAADLEEILWLLLALVAADCSLSGQVPPRFADRLRAQLEKATHGGLRNLLVMAASIESRCVRTFYGYLESEERRGRGWLSRMVGLRNERTHPKNRPVSAVDAEALELYADCPPIIAQLGCAADPDGVVQCIGADESFPVSPFAVCIDGEPAVLCGLEDDGRARYTNGTAAHAGQIQATLQNLRKLDSALENPVVEDFRAKAQKTSIDKPHDEPWWLREVTAPGPATFLVPPETIRPAIASLGQEWPEGGDVVVEPNENAAAGDVLAKSLGLARPPSVTELSGLNDLSTPFVLAFEANDLSRRSFRDLMLWILDLSKETPRDGVLRVLIGRDRTLLERDEKSLRDRLPSDLDRYLRRPPRSKGITLSSMQWPREKPRRFFGLF